MGSRQGLQGLRQPGAAGRGYEALVLPVFNPRGGPPGRRRIAVKRKPPRTWSGVTEGELKRFQDGPRQIELGEKLLEIVVGMRGRQRTYQASMERQSRPQTCGWSSTMAPTMALRVRATSSK